MGRQPIIDEELLQHAVLLARKNYVTDFAFVFDWQTYRCKIPAKGKPVFKLICDAQIEFVGIVAKGESASDDPRFHVRLHLPEGTEPENLLLTSAQCCSPHCLNAALFSRQVTFLGTQRDLDCIRRTWSPRFEQGLKQSDCGSDPLFPDTRGYTIDNLAQLFEVLDKEFNAKMKSVIRTLDGQLLGDVYFGLNGFIRKAAYHRNLSSIGGDFFFRLGHADDASVLLGKVYWYYLNETPMTREIVAKLVDKYAYNMLYAIPENVVEAILDGYSEVLRDRVV